MLKFLLIGVGIIGVLFFILWNVWKMMLLKCKCYSESQLYFDIIYDFKDVPKRLRAVKFQKIKVWALTLICTAAAIATVSTYFVMARNYHAANHMHNYSDSVVKKPTCVEEGVLEQKCRFCDDRYEESIACVEHDYSKTERQEATCSQEGQIKRICVMCGDEQSEQIPLKEHKYVDRIEKEPSCTSEGILVKQCKNCDDSAEEIIGINDEHSYEIASYTKSSFWKNGYSRYECEDCGKQDYSLKTQKFNWIVLVAIIVLVVAVGIIIFIRSEEGYWEYTVEKPMFWISLVLALVSIAFMVLHWGGIVAKQERLEPIFSKYSGAPIECELDEGEIVESTYTENGTVTYKCQKCKRSYTEYLELKEVDLEQISIYKEPTMTAANEIEGNEDFDSATEIPLYTKVTGNLSTNKDVDFYKVTLATDGNLRFKFTHDGNAYSYHWDAAIYSPDKVTVLTQGYISTDSFGCSNLKAGTYYLKISVITGGNPIMNQYSEADYHLVFSPECAQHVDKTQYFAKMPKCKENIETTTVCNACGMIVDVQNDQKLEHRWGEWEIIKSSTLISRGEKMRSCSLCDEAEHKGFMEHWWVIPLAVVELITLIVCTVVLFKDPDICILQMLLLLALSVASVFTVIKIPIFNSVLWDSVMLGVVLALNSVLITEYLYKKIENVRRYGCDRYKVIPIVIGVLLAVMFVLGLTVLKGYAITCIAVMAALAIYATIMAIVAHADYENGWMTVNIVVAAMNIASAVVFWFRM